MKLHGYAIEHEGKIHFESFDTSAARVAARELVALAEFEPADFAHWADCEANGYRVVPVTIEVRKTGAPVNVELADGAGIISALALLEG